MSDAMKNKENNVPNTTNDSAAKMEAVHKILDGGVTKGTIKLTVPIRAGGTDVDKLDYDFSKLTGWEYVEAMDADPEARNVFKITQKQALCLFAAAAGKATPNIDATDIKQRISAVDTLRVVQLATVFLAASTRAARENT